MILETKYIEKKTAQLGAFFIVSKIERRHRNCFSLSFLSISRLMLILNKFTEIQINLCHEILISLKKSALFFGLKRKNSYVRVCVPNNTSPPFRFRSHLNLILEINFSC